MNQAIDLLIRAPRAVTGDATESERPLAVGVINGRIVAVEPLDATTLVGRDVLELDKDVVLLPGLVDSHVHVCEPGHTEWEGFASATRAAAAGGITTLVDMPLDSAPVTVSVDALRAKQRTAQSQAHVDVAFWAGVIPGNTPDLEPLAAAGVPGFKCFLAGTRVTRLPAVDTRQLTEALHVTARLGLPLLVHAESAAASAPGRLTATPGYAGLSRPPAPPRPAEPGRGPGHRGGPGHRRARAHRPLVQLRRAAHDRLGAARGRPDHRRDLPALPDPDRRGDRRRPDDGQVLPAGPRGRQPRAALDRAARPVDQIVSMIPGAPRR